MRGVRWPERFARDRSNVPSRHRTAAFGAERSLGFRAWMGVTGDQETREMRGRRYDNNRLPGFGSAGWYELYPNEVTEFIFTGPRKLKTWLGPRAAAVSRSNRGARTQPHTRRAAALATTCHTRVTRPTRRRSCRIDVSQLTCLVAALPGAALACEISCFRFARTRGPPR